MKFSRTLPFLISFLCADIVMSDCVKRTIPFGTDTIIANQILKKQTISFQVPADVKVKTSHAISFVTGLHFRTCNLSGLALRLALRLAFSSGFIITTCCMYIISPSTRAQIVGDISQRTLERCARQSRQAHPRSVPAIYEVIAVWPIPVSACTSTYLPWCQARTV